MSEHDELWSWCGWECDLLTTGVRLFCASLLALLVDRLCFFLATKLFLAHFRLRGRERVKRGSIICHHVDEFMHQGMHSINEAVYACGSHLAPCVLFPGKLVFYRLLIIIIRV